MSRQSSLGSTGLKPINLEEIWTDLEDGINQIYLRERNLIIKRYMELYTSVVTNVIYFDLNAMRMQREREGERE
uniref:Cullin N-terminal domain-containing protein n=1 Tax=Phlebotomus papatasi TaxID=29031 RepID=A0A1B0GNU3_PHLPP